MKTDLYRITGSLLLCAAFLCPLAAQVGAGADSVLSVRQLYESAQFEAAIEAGRIQLRRPETATPPRLLLIHQYMALSHYSIGEVDSAQSHLLSMLAIEPAARLDPVNTSPKILEFFAKLREDFQTINPGLEPDNGFARYIFVEDLRPGAAWRSVLLPGWGQFYKNQTRRGLVYGGLFFASLSATLMSRIRESGAEDDYLNAGPTEVADAYDTYNFWYQSRRTLALTTVIIWGVAVADALWSPARQPEVRVNGDGQVLVGLSIAL